MTARRNRPRPDDTRDLVLAAFHEFGNHLAAARICAHLLPLSEDAAELRSGVDDIESVVTQAAALLAHVRPLLRDDVTRVRVAVPRLLEVVAFELRALGVDDSAVRVRVPSRGPDIRVDASMLQPVLVSLALAGAEPGSPAPALVSARRLGDQVRVRVHHPGPRLDPAEIDTLSGQRGRLLAVRLARAVLRRAGGRLELPPSRTGAHLDLLFRILKPR